LGGKLRWRLPTPAGFAGQTKANIDNMTVNPEKSLINMVVSSFHEIHPNSQAIEIKQFHWPRTGGAKQETYKNEGPSRKLLCYQCDMQRSVGYPEKYMKINELCVTRDTTS
jgi:hypothetical protein